MEMEGLSEIVFSNTGPRVRQVSLSEEWTLFLRAGLLFRIGPNLHCSVSAIIRTWLFKQNRLRISASRRNSAFAPMLLDARDKIPHPPEFAGGNSGICAVTEDFCESAIAAITVSLFFHTDRERMEVVGNVTVVRGRTPVYTANVSGTCVEEPVTWRKPIGKLLELLDFWRVHQWTKTNSLIQWTTRFL